MRNIPYGKILFIPLILLVFAGTSAALSTGNSAFALVSVANYFTNSLDSTYYLVLIAVLMVAAIAGFVYMLSKVVSSNNGMNWAKSQIYNAIIAVILVLLFISLTGLMFSNPQSLLSGAGALPSTCSAANVNTVFNLSMCDLSTFTVSGYAMMQTVYYLSYFEGLAPGIEASTNIPFTVPGVGVSTEIPSFMPESTVEMTSTILDAMIFMLMLNQLQMLILAGAPLFLTLFLSIGIFAWVFGISRRFGGTMLALGLGLGIVFPILISITYGFLDHGILTMLGNVTQVSDIFSAMGSIFANTINAFFSLAELWLTGSAAASSSYQVAMSQITTLLSGLGYIFAGLTFLPFLNFTILDAFVVDLSKAIGERTSFMELITGLI